MIEIAVPVKSTAAHALRARRIGDAMISRLVVACALALGVTSPVFAGDCVPRQLRNPLLRKRRLPDGLQRQTALWRNQAPACCATSTETCCAALAIARRTTLWPLCCARRDPAAMSRGDSYGKVTCADGCQDAKAQLVRGLAVIAKGPSRSVTAPARDERHRRFAQRDLAREPENRETTSLRAHS